MAKLLISKEIEDRYLNNKPVLSTEYHLYNDNLL